VITHAFACWDHSAWITQPPSVWVVLLQMSPISSPVPPSNQPEPAGSVIASHSSWLLTLVRLSSGWFVPKTQPAHVMNGSTA
jgi:hypothetical protein